MATEFLLHCNDCNATAESGLTRETSCFRLEWIKENRKVLSYISENLWTFEVADYGESMSVRFAIKHFQCQDIIIQNECGEIFKPTYEFTEVKK